MADTTQLARQWKLLHILSSRRHGATVRELVSELDVNDKTIRRDLQFLTAEGFPLIETVGDFGRKSWALDSSTQILALRFNFTEVLALYLGRRALEPLVGTSIWTGAQSAYGKIRATLGEGAVAYLDKLARVFQPTQVAASDYSKQAELVERILIATEDHRITWIVYQSANATEPVSTEVYPLTLLWHRGSLYLLAHSREDDKVKTYKIDRISDVEVTPLKFNYPTCFDPQQFLSTSFGIMQSGGPASRVQIRFDATVARYVAEKTWHSSQILKSNRDGSLTAEFELNDLHELKAWILSFGPKAEVLSPTSLRNEVIDDLTRMVARYSSEIPSEFDVAASSKVRRRRAKG